MTDRVDRGQAVKLIRQNCIERMRAQPAGSVGCVVTSPHYYLGVSYGKHDDSTSVRGYLDWMTDVVRSIGRVLKEDGHFFLNVGYSNKEPWGDMDVAKRAGMCFELQNRFIGVKSVAIDE